MDFYYLVWGLVAICVFVLVRIQQSRIGRCWNYVREDEIAAEAMGIDTRWAKLAAFTLGAAIAGATGLFLLQACSNISREFHFYGIGDSLLHSCPRGMGSIPE